MDLYANSPFDESFSFFRSDLVSTARSTSPLDCGKRGLLVVCLKSHSLAKLVNSAEACCEPLSLLTSSGILCLVKITFNYDDFMRLGGLLHGSYFDIAREVIHHYQVI